MTRPARIPLPVFRYAPPGPVHAYIVYEHELDRLAQGPPAALFLNFALFFLGTAVSGAGTLVSMPPDSDRAYYTFLLITLVAGVAGVVLVALWWVLRDAAGNLLAEIKSRMPASPETGPDPPTGPVSLP